MAENLSSIGYAGYGLETTEGVIVAPSIFLPVNSFDIESTVEPLIPEQLRGSRDRYVSMPGPYSVSGSMGMELTPVGIGPLLISAFSAKGNVTSGAYSGGGYEHVMLPGQSSPTFSFETSHADILFLRYGGIRVNTLEINSAFGEIVTATWGLEGTTRAKQGSGTSETYGEALPFHFTGSSVKLDGVEKGNISQFTFTVGNNVERRGTLRKTLSWKRTLLGSRDVGFTATMDFEDTSDYDLFFGGTEFALDLHLEGGFITGSSGPKHTLRIEIPRVTWTSIGAPLNAGDFIEQAVTATIVRPMNDDPVFTATLVTTDETLLGAS